MQQEIFFCLVWIAMFIREIIDSRSERAKEKPIYGLISLAFMLLFAFLISLKVENIIKLLHP